ncbi:MAG: ASKHA domain-containing protein [Candidatus Korarchaeota archaeon]|nr:ASKHA domain-containing protein [Candidatus Korarchaeota archaeon]
MDYPTKKWSLLAIFQPEGRRGWYSTDKTILEAAKDLGVDITSICGGLGLCGKCKVIIREGKDLLSPPSSSEERYLEPGELRAGFRLACQARFSGRGKVVVEVPEQSRSGRQRLLVEGKHVEVELNPAVHIAVLKLPKPSLSDPRAHFERLISKIPHKGSLRADLRVLRYLPRAVKKGNWTVTIVWHTDVGLLDVRPGEDERLYGFAVDIGTTKLAGYLVDLRSGELVSVSSAPNPQIPFGEDVIARIAHSRTEEGFRELHRVIIQGINGLIRDACESARVDPRLVVELVVAGNTLMHHLFLGLPPRDLAEAPYTPVIDSPLDVRASDLGVEMLPTGNVHLLPNVAGFVGADAVADVLSTGIHLSSELSFMIDVGTNTEIVIGNSDEMHAVSCASGPAFEGAHIKFGMRATSGAIERVWIDPNTLDVKYSVVDGVSPKGICGSGIVDALAEMLSAGVIDTTGKILEREHERIRKGPDGMEFILAFADETAIGKDIVITQRDVRELQKAKAAMHTGASILMSEMGVSVKDVERVFMAGAFGLYIDPASAKRIGMLPDFPLEKITQVGNAAGVGARVALISIDKRRECWEIAQKIRYYELAAHPRFQEEFMASMYLPHLDLFRFQEVVEKMDGLVVADRHKNLLEKLKSRLA